MARSGSGAHVGAWPVLAPFAPVASTTGLEVLSLNEVQAGPGFWGPPGCSSSTPLHSALLYCAHPIPIPTHLLHSGLSSTVACGPPCAPTAPHLPLQPGGQLRPPFPSDKRGGCCSTRVSCLMEPQPLDMSPGVQQCLGHTEMGFPCASRKDFSRPGCALLSESDSVEVTLCHGRKHSRSRKRRNLNRPHPASLPCPFPVGEEPQPVPSRCTPPTSVQVTWRDAYHSLLSWAGSSPRLCIISHCRRAHALPLLLSCWAHTRSP